MMRSVKTFGRFLAIGVLLGSFLAPAGFPAAQILPAPSIAVHPDVYYAPDEILYVEGTAKPNATIELQFRKQGAKPVKLIAKSDAKGEWVLAEKVPLKAGEWEVQARLVEGGSASDWSNPRVFRAIVTGVTIAGVTVKFTFLALLLVASVAVALYLVFRIRREVRARTEVLIEKDFAELRQDITEELRHLERKRRLSREEEEHRDKLLRDLDQIEREVERKIKGV